MKTIEQILRQEPVFMKNWKCKNDVFESFGIESDEDVNILFAYYSYEDYYGLAFVLVEKSGQLYEVHGSHCSCYGLDEEDADGSVNSQWDMEETNLEVLEHKLTNGEFGFDDYCGNYFREELCDFLGVTLPI